MRFSCPVLFVLGRVVNQGTLRYFKPPLFLCATLLAIGVIGSGYALSRLEYPFKEPREISQRFIALVLAGNLTEAYRLTDQGPLVGRTLEAFAANARRQLGVAAFPLDSPVQWRGFASGGQTYGHRLRRWSRGKKRDPDFIVLDYDLRVPFKIRLRSDQKGRWTIDHFQSHAA